MQAEVSFNNVMKNLYVKIAEQGKMEDSEIEAFLDDLLDSLSDDHVDNLLQQSAKHESITQYIQFVKLVHGVDDDWIYVGEDGDPLEDFKDFVRWLVRARVGPVKEVPPNAAPAQVEKVPEDTAEAQAPHNAAPAEVEEVPDDTAGTSVPHNAAPTQVEEVQEDTAGANVTHNPAPTQVEEGQEDTAGANVTHNPAPAPVEEVQEVTAGAIVPHNPALAPVEEVWRRFQMKRQWQTCLTIQPHPKQRRCIKTRQGQRQRCLAIQPQHQHSICQRQTQALKRCRNMQATPWRTISRSCPSTLL